MTGQTILKQRRFANVPLAERVVIRACETTAYDCAWEGIVGCREQLDEPRATSAAIIGATAALARMLAETPDPESMLWAVKSVLESELQFRMGHREGAAS